MSDDRPVGYRDQAPAPAEPPNAVELLDPTPDEETALARLRARESASLYGSLIPLGIMCCQANMLSRSSLQLQLAVWGLVISAAIYGVVKLTRRGAIGPVLVRLSPGGAAKAGAELRVRVALRPRKSIPLDPLALALVARGADGKAQPVLYESTRLLAEGVTLAEAKGVVFEAAFPLSLIHI